MEKMSLKTFEHLLSIYGADISRWPDVDARDVFAFMDVNPQAKAQFDNASELDALLSLYVAPEMNADKITVALSQPESVVPDYAKRSMVPAMVKMGSRAGAGLALLVLIMGAATWSLQSRDNAAPNLNRSQPLQQQHVVATRALTNKVATARVSDADKIDDVLVIAAADIKEQQQMQELLALLGEHPKNAPVTNEVDDIDLLLLDVFTIDEQDIEQMFSEG